MSSRLPVTDARQSALQSASKAWTKLVDVAVQVAESKDSERAEVEAELDGSAYTYLCAVKEYELAVRIYWAEQPDHVIALRTRSLPRSGLDRLLFLERVHSTGLYREGDELMIHRLRAKYEVLMSTLESVRYFHVDSPAIPALVAMMRNLRCLGLPVTN